MESDNYMDNIFDEAEYNKLIEKYNYKDMLHETFKNVIVPELKKRGYKRKGKTFYRERDGLIEICEVQFSRFNHRTTASFTYNIQIAIPSLYDLLGIQYADKLETVIFDIRFGGIVLWASRISSLWDYWYRLEAYSSNTPYRDDAENFDELGKIRSIFYRLDNRYNVKTGEGFAEVVVDDIVNIIIRFFESIPNAELLLQLINHDEPHGHIDETMMLTVAELYYFNGECEKGRRIFNKIRHGLYHVIIDRYVEDGDIVL